MDMIQTETLTSMLMIGFDRLFTSDAFIDAVGKMIDWHPALTEDSA